MWWELFLGAVLGTLFSIAVTVVFEKQKRPQLTMKIVVVEAAHYPPKSHPADDAQFLYVKLINENLSRFWSVFINRNVTLGCRGRISFHRLDGTPLYERWMTLRWTRSDEYNKFMNTFQLQDGSVVTIFDKDRFNYATAKKDITPGDEELFNIACRYDKDENCYGWSNDSYSSTPQWRNPDWEIPKGVFLANIEIVSSTIKVSKVFRIMNDLSIKDFRLSPALPQDKIISVKEPVNQP